MKRNRFTNLVSGTWPSLRDKWIAATPQLIECVLYSVPPCGETYNEIFDKSRPYDQVVITKSGGGFKPPSNTKTRWPLCPYYRPRICSTLLPLTIQAVGVQGYDGY